MYPSTLMPLKDPKQSSMLQLTVQPLICGKRSGTESLVADKPGTGSQKDQGLILHLMSLDSLEFYVHK